MPSDSLPCLLLVGGGEGMGKLEATVEQLDARLGGRAQVVVVCGRNRALLERLRARRFANGLAVTAVGFVDNVHEWMAAADAIITKAGPGTIAEALISGLPILLNGNIPCQVRQSSSRIHCSHSQNNCCTAAIAAAPPPRERPAASLHPVAAPPHSPAPIPQTCAACHSAWMSRGLPPSLKLRTAAACANTPSLTHPFLL